MAKGCKSGSFLLLGEYYALTAVLVLFHSRTYQFQLNSSYWDRILEYLTGLELPQLSAGVNREFKVFFLINC